MQFGPSDSDSNQRQFGGGGHVDLADVLLDEPELVENVQNLPLSLLVLYWSNCSAIMENFNSKF